MKIINTNETKLEIKTTTKFDKQLKKLYKQGKDIEKLIYVIQKLANKQKLDFKFRNHSLNDNKIYKNCKECHIEPDWLLIYQIKDNELILLLFATGSHSELFEK